jgi:prephenate dehydrogenase
VSLDPSAALELGTVRVVGTGLLGASVGLGLSASGTRVLLADSSPTALALARDLGAGVPDPGTEPVDLVVVAAPPDVTAVVVAEELKAHPDAVVTDVASVKTGILTALGVCGADLRQYVGSHPMAGRERSGAVAARGDLFLGRPWVLSPAPDGDAAATSRVRRLALALGAVPVAMPAHEHDEAVALVSHLPQVAASLVAARLRHAPDAAVALAGQGLRDVTRIAASDPALWAQILAANAGPVAAVLSELRADLDQVLTALQAIAAEAPGEHDAPAIGARGAVARAVADGNLGRERIPGKHGGVPARYAVVTVLIPDQPGALGHVFADIATAGTNVEEVALEHAPGRAVGLLEVSVLPAVREHLEEALTAAGWHVVA